MKRRLATACLLLAALPVGAESLACRLDWVAPLIEEGGRWAHAYSRASDWFREWGFWAVLVAGFSPIPYKVFTITAGVIAMPLLPFTLASLLGRGARFFLVAALMAWGGERMEGVLRQYIDRVGWIMVILVIAVVVAAGF